MSRQIGVKCFSSEAKSSVVSEPLNKSPKALFQIIPGLAEINAQRNSEKKGGRSLSKGLGLGKTFLGEL